MVQKGACPMSLPCFVSLKFSPNEQCRGYVRWTEIHGSWQAESMEKDWIKQDIHVILLHTFASSFFFFFFQIMSLSLYPKCQSISTALKGETHRGPKGRAWVLWYVVSQIHWSLGSFWWWAPLIHSPGHREEAKMEHSISSVPCAGLLHPSGLGGTRDRWSYPCFLAIGPTLLHLTLALQKWKGTNGAVMGKICCMLPVGVLA